MMIDDRPVPGEIPILDSLRSIGYNVTSLAELRQSGKRYRDAVPILVAALSEPVDSQALTEVVRALSVPWAKPTATLPLIELFRRVEDISGLGLRWVVGNALEITWDDDYFEDLVELACDPAYGRSREMIVLGLAKSARPEVGKVLIRLLDDSDVSGHAVKALRKVKIPEAREGLKRMLDDDRAWVRKEAQRALTALG